MSFTTLIVAALAIFAPINAAPTPSTSFVSLSSRQSNATSADFQTQNGLDAQKLNAEFASIMPTDSCQTGTQACVDSSFAQCVSGNWSISPCAAGTKCFALPLVNKAGTSLSCDSQSDAEARFAAAGVSGGVTGQESGTGTTAASAAGSTATDAQGSGYGSDGTDNDNDSGTNDDDCGDDSNDGTNDNSGSTDGYDGDNGNSGSYGGGGSVNNDENGQSSAPCTSTSAPLASATDANPQNQDTAATTIFLNAPASSTTSASQSIIILSLPAASGSAAPSQSIINLNKRQYTFASTATPAIATAPSFSVAPVASPSPFGADPAPVPTGPEVAASVPVATATAIPNAESPFTTAAPVPTAAVSDASPPTFTTTGVDGIVTVMIPFIATVTVTTTVGVGESTALSAPPFASASAFGEPAASSPVSILSSPSIIALTTSNAASSVPTVSSTTSAAAGFSFSFATAAPSPSPATGTGSVDIAQLLTATIPA